jgi:uncharacterized protein DUF1508
MPGKFEIFFRWALYSPLFSLKITFSQGYKSKDSALNGIKAVQTHAPVAKVADETG